MTKKKAKKKPIKKKVVKKSAKKSAHKKHTKKAVKKVAKKKGKKTVKKKAKKITLKKIGKVSPLTKHNTSGNTTHGTIAGGTPIIFDGSIHFEKCPTVIQAVNRKFSMECVIMSHKENFGTVDIEVTNISNTQNLSVSPHNFILDSGKKSTLKIDGELVDGDGQFKIVVSYVNDNGAPMSIERTITVKH